MWYLDLLLWKKTATDSFCSGQISDLLDWALLYLYSDTWLFKGNYSFMLLYTWKKKKTGAHTKYKPYILWFIFVHVFCITICHAIWYLSEGILMLHMINISFNLDRLYIHGILKIDMQFMQFYQLEINTMNIPGDR